MDLTSIIKRLFPKTTRKICSEGYHEGCHEGFNKGYDDGWVAGYDALENEISEALELDEKSGDYCEPVVWHVKCMIKKNKYFKETLAKELGEDEEDL